MITKSELCAMAVEASENAYSPYSQYRVGAALLCADGSVFTGCNIENASYSATNCAERVAVQNALSNGKKDFLAIAVAGGREIVGEEPCPPCGICRQVLAEFCHKESFKILLVEKEGFKEYSLGELLPESFSKTNL